MDRMGKTLAALVVLGLLGLCQAVAIPGVKTTERYNQSEILDTQGNYLLFWNFNDTHVTFEVHVKSKGWVGFGFSDNGNMYPADVAIGWVTDDGAIHFADRHATAHQMPEKDKSQDWHLLHGEENEFGTVLKFIRKKDTCDVVEDKEIQEGTSRLIYAYSDADPVSDDAILYHYTTRGTKSVDLFNTDEVPETLPPDVIHYDLLNENYLLPSDPTTYRCRAFQMPAIGKHHMIKFESVITPGNEMNVHHMVLYRCKVTNAQAHHGKTGMCYDNRPADLPYCYNLFLAWAIGGKPYYFPESVGFPVGEERDNTLFVLETHFDNPHRRTGVLDNSGLRITLTKTLRPNEAGSIEVGQDVNFYQVIPPHEEAFVSSGYCSQDCVEKVMTHDKVSEIKVFAAFQHAHLLGAAIKTRHIRNGTELEPIINEPAYDFNFQQTVQLPKEHIIKSTDSIQVDCTYNSKNRNRPTFGGLSTQEEMCLTFLYYYPRVNFNMCTSQQTFSPTGVAMTGGETYQLYSTFDWDNATAVAELKADLKKSYVTHSCTVPSMAETTTNFIEKEPDHPYVPPKSTCSG